MEISGIIHRCWNVLSHKPSHFQYSLKLDLLNHDQQNSHIHILTRLLYSIRFCFLSFQNISEERMSTPTKEYIEKLEKLKREGETLNDVTKRIVETYEELMDYIDEKWEKLQRDKEKFIDLEDYASLRGL